MFNHARTLLMNVSGAAPMPGDFPGEEAIPPDFAPVVLPAAMQSARQRLFGVNPDRAMLNYRMRQYMTILHATELAEFVFALDKRITYLPFKQDLFAPMTPRIAPSQGTISGLYLQGAPTAPDESGRMYYQFNIQLTGATATMRQSAPVQASATITLNETDHLYGPLIFGQTGYRGLLTGDGSWSVDGYLRPTWDLGQLLAGVQALNPAAIAGVFGPAAAEPFMTFKNLFERNNQLAWQLGGFLLAVIYQTQALYTASA